MRVRATQYAGTILRKRRHAYGPVAGAAMPASRARANGRYSRQPEMTKKTATPASRRAAYWPSVVPLLVSSPAKTAAWVASTASAAIARSESINGKRRARSFTAGIFPPMHPPPRRFAQSVAGAAVCGGLLRLADLLPVARHTVGIGEWCFSHWQATLTAAGRGFLAPFQLPHPRVGASAGPPPL